MADTLIIIHTAVAIIGVVLLVLKAKLDPVLSLVIGTVYLGLVAGLGPEKTVEVLVMGFGDLMAEIGLLIVFGVLLGSILSYMGAVQKMVDVLLKIFGPKTIPYALGLTVGTVFQSIFADVLLVITAPLGRSLAHKIGKNGTARIATSLSVGILFGLTMMVPSVGALALSALVGIPLGKYLLFGTIVAVLGITITLLIMSFLFTKTGFWKPALDEQPFEEDPETANSQDHEGSGPRTPRPADTDSRTKPSPNAVLTDEGKQRADVPDTPRSDAGPSLLVSMSPLILSLILIAFGSIAQASGLESSLISFFANPVVALFLGLMGAYLILRRRQGGNGVATALSRGFKSSGEILALTGLGGSLAAMVGAIGLGDVLEGFFSTNTGAPIVLAWLIAVVLHLAIGSVSVASITSAGLLAPVAASVGIDPILIALAAAAGSLFMVTVTSNFFWMMQTLLGQTTRGALKTVSLSTSVASVVGLGLVLALSLFL